MVHKVNIYKQEKGKPFKDIIFDIDITEDDIRQIALDKYRKMYECYDDLYDYSSDIDRTIIVRDGL